MILGLGHILCYSLIILLVHLVVRCSLGLKSLLEACKHLAISFPVGGSLLPSHRACASRLLGVSLTTGFKLAAAVFQVENGHLHNSRLGGGEDNIKQVFPQSLGK